MTSPDPVGYARHAVSVLEAGRFTWQSEDDLQAELTAALDAAGWTVTREVRLGGRAGRIDLLADWPDANDHAVARVGVEVKVAGSPTAVARQLQRYARSDAALDVVVLATTQPTHRDMPATLGGKPLLVAVLTGGAW